VSAPAKAVHRLIEIVVEEVSLVDRAANNHRFLIVKRAEGETDHAMADLNEPNDDDLDDDPSPGDTLAPTLVLEVATKALAALTDAVEKLGAGAEDAAAVSEIAADLRAAADDLAKMVGAEPAVEQEPLPPELRDALDALPDAQREAVTLIQVEGLSVAEAALKVGISPGALKVRAHRGYRALRDALAGLREGGGWISARPPAPEESPLSGRKPEGRGPDG